MGALLVALLRRRVLNKGLRNGSSLWLVIGAFGVAAALLLGTAGVLLTLALLRGLQTALSYERVKETTEGFVAQRGPLSGSWTWLPYVLTALAGAIVVGIIAFAASRDAKRTKR